MVVNINQVIAHTSVTRWDRWKMEAVLKKQGQIEPLQVQVYHPAIDGKPEHYITCQQDPWGPAIVEAAKSLKWDTLLIVVVKKYIP